MTTFLLLLLVALVVVGGVFLVTWDIPPPTQPVEIEIPSDRLRQQ